MEQTRQGDILLVASDERLPQGVEPMARVTLAKGELTGHAHTLTAPAVFDWRVDGQRYVRVSGGVGMLYHEDHDPVPVPVLSPDVTYRVIPQQETDLSGQWRKVID